MPEVEQPKPTVKSLYKMIQSLSTIEQFELAKLILNGLPPEAIVDYSTEWSDEDLRDLSHATAKLIDERFGSEEGNYD